MVTKTFKFPLISMRKENTALKMEIIKDTGLFATTRKEKKFEVGKRYILEHDLTDGIYECIAEFPVTAKNLNCVCWFEGYCHLRLIDEIEDIYEIEVGDNYLLHTHIFRKV